MGLQWHPPPPRFFKTTACELPRLHFIYIYYPDIENFHEFLVFLLKRIKANESS